MKKIILTVSGINLNTNQIEDYIFKASNPFMMLKYYMQIRQKLFIKSYTVYHKGTEFGNTHPINAGAYLCGYMQELTGINLD